MQPEVDKLGGMWAEEIRSQLPWLEGLGVAPRPLLALLALAVGLMVAVAGRAVATRLTKRLAKKLATWSNSAAPEDAGSYASAVGMVAYWTPLVLAAVLASELLGLSIVTRWLSQIAEYLPRLIAAVLIVVFGLLAAKGVGQIVQRAATTARLPSARRLRRAVEVSISLASVVVAVEQLGIEFAFLKAFVLILLAAILGGAALSFGLGSRDIVANVLSAHYLQKVYQVGQVIRFEGVEGRILRITEIALIVDDGDGEVVIPAQQLAKAQSKLILDPRAR